MPQAKAKPRAKQPALKRRKTSPTPKPKAAPRPPRRPPSPAPRSKVATAPERPAQARRTPQAPRTAGEPKSTGQDRGVTSARPKAKAAQARPRGSHGAAAGKTQRRGPATHPAIHRATGHPKAKVASAGRNLGTFEATAYGPPWGGIQGSGVTATGIDLRHAPHEYIIAVDPSVIPLHTRVTVSPNPFGNNSIVFRAEDTGGAIIGKHVDIYDWRGRGHQLGWGRRNVTVTEIPSDAIIRNIPGIGAIVGGNVSGGSGSSSAPTPAPRYFNPLAHAKVTPERIDQGVDYAGTGYLVAIADGVITESVANGSGWEDEGYLEYRITQPGELEGAYVYYAEGINPVVHVDERVRGGSRLCDLRVPMPHGIEIGFAAGTHQWSYYRYHDGLYDDRSATRPGIAFSNLIARLGGPPGRIEGPVVGKFPEYMTSGEPNPAITASPSDTSTGAVGGGINAVGQFDWPGATLSAFVQLQRGANNGSHHSHAAWFYARGVTYVPKSAT